MNLYLKQKVFSLKDKFNVYDEQGNEKYYVEGQLFSLGKKLHVYDNSQNEIAFIHQKLISFLPRYFFGMNGNDIAKVTKKISFLTQKYVVDGLNWEVNGDFFAHEYEIKSGNKNIAVISKKWLSWGDTYEISVIDDKDTLSALCVVLIIDAITSNDNNDTVVLGAD